MAWHGMHQAAGASWKQEIVIKPSGRKTSDVGHACKGHQKNLLLIRVCENSENVPVYGWHKSICRTYAIMPIDAPCIVVSHHVSSCVIRYLNVTSGFQAFSFKFVGNDV
jgi:hypothetical protein